MKKEYKFEDIFVTYKDDFTTLSPRLFVKQNAWDNLQRIKDLHRRRMVVFHYIHDKPYSTLKRYVKLIEDIEYALQDAWGFERNKSMHTWWYRVPKCSCPKTDNRNLTGTSQRLVNTDCIVHKHLFR